MSQIKYRVATRCLRCGARYRSTEIEEQRPPVRCKKCKSSKTEVEYSPENYDVFASDQVFLEVRS